MKKILMILIALVYSIVAVAQKVKPVVIAKPNTAFLQKLQTVAISLTSKSSRLPDNTQRKFVALVKTANNATTWDKDAYKAFVKLATPIIKLLGIKSDPDDGGEIFSDPDDGGEVFASSKLISKALNIVFK